MTTNVPKEAFVPPAAPEAMAKAPLDVGQAMTERVGTANQLASAVVPLVGMVGATYLMWNGLKMIAKGANPFKSTKS